MKNTLKRLGIGLVWGLLPLGTLTAASQNEVEILLTSELSTPLVVAGKTQTTFLKVGLTGFQLKQQVERTPANIAIVLDRSGSMSGEKLIRAKEAAELAVNLLNEKDIVSIISYDSVVEILVSATRVREKEKIIAALRSMTANGYTALFAGVSKGAEEVRKFMDKERVNRVILLSDGQANVGPNSPTALGDLGRSLGKDGISVTTIGLGEGYNEDLMTNLAGFSDGNHAFVENAEDLVKIFKYEFGDVLSVVAQDVELQIQCAEGVKPVRIIGRDGVINGQTVTTRLNQLYSEQEKYILLEIEVPAGEVNQKAVLATVDVVYQNMFSKRTDKLKNSVNIAYSASAEKAAAAVNTNVIKAATKQIANEVNKQALELRDQGQAEAAKQLLEQNVNFVREKASTLDDAAAEELEAFGADIAKDAEAITEDEEWNTTRKQLRAKQFKLDKQQAY